MTFEWHVVLRDSSGSKITDAEVAVVPASAIDTKEFPFPDVTKTHAPGDDGTYEPASEIAPTDGKWLLIVRRRIESSGFEIGGQGRRPQHHLHCDVP
jgi:hypothetical protein